MRLKSKIVLLLVPCIFIPLAVSGWLGYGDRLAALEQRALEDIEQVASDVHTRFDDMLATANSNLTLLAGSHLVDRYVRVESETLRYQLMYRSVVELFNDYQRSFPEYAEIRLLLEDGQEEIRLTREFVENRSQSESNTPWFQQMLSSGDKGLAMLYRNPDTNNFTILLAREAGRESSKSRFKQFTQSFMAITLDLGPFIEWMEAKPVGESGALMLLSREGVLPLGGGPQGGRIEQSLVAQLSQWSTAEVELRTIEGKNYYLSAQRLISGLYVVALLPAAEAEQEAGNIAARVAITVIIVMILSAVMLYWALNDQILKPLNQLRMATDRLAIGDWGPSLTGQRPDEIGELAQSFETMSRSLRHTSQTLIEAAERDSLTGLRNRRMLISRIEMAISPSDSDRGSSVLFLDLDGFKEINDTKGHASGDLVLREVTKRLQSTIDELPENIDVELARVGGDEFAILMMESHHSGEPERLAQAIIDGIQVPFKVDDQSFYIGMSIGIARNNQQHTDAETLIRHADLAMYEAKKTRRNSYMRYNERLSESAHRRHKLQSDLRVAAAENQLHLLYQPQIGVESGGIVGCEALIRWQHPTLGLISPLEFIPLAEESGLIVDIGQWVAEEACRQINSWHEQGFKAVKVSINVSGVQFKQSDVEGMIRRSILESGVAPELLGIEITESEMMGLDDRVLVALKRIREMGVWVALDDFGTGYSSLSALKHLPIDNLKVDKSFIDEIDKRDGQSIFRAIIAMCEPLGLSVTAEGVENREQHLFVAACGCDRIQGYLFSKPVDASELATMLTKQFI